MVKEMKMYVASQNNTVFWFNVTYNLEVLTRFSQGSKVAPGKGDRNNL